MSWWSTLINDIANAGGFGIAGDAAQTATKSAGGLGAVAAEIAGIWAGLTDGKMWRSLGWIVLGIVLMLLGVILWIGPKAAIPAGGAIGRAYGAVRYRY